MRIFAVTYTYNDAALVDALLGEMLRWPLKPSDILVVDDGSTPPYAPGAKPPRGAGGLVPQILRLAPNQGPARAKRAGLRAAAQSGAEVILSLDADIRPHPDWLSVALPYLARPGTGLVGAAFAHGLGGDSLSRYLRAFFTPAAEDKEAPFLGAGLWLMRGDVWAALGGLDDFDQATHEDLYFCRKLTAAGLKMWAVNSRPVRQIRRLHRCAYFRREVAYLGRAVRTRAQNRGLENALQPLEQQASARLRYILERGEAEFLYLEIFKYAAMLAWLRANPGGAPGQDTADGGVSGPNALGQGVAAGELLFRCLGGLVAYPNTLALLCADLAAIGLPQGLCRIIPAALAAVPWLEAERLHPLLLKLEMHGVREFAREEREMPFDGHYLAPII